MNIQLHSTIAIVEFNGTKCRVWEGITEAGVEVYALIPRIAHKDNEPEEKVQQFRDELQEMQAPSNDAIRCFNLRQII